MIDELLQDITIYSKDGANRYNLRASVRNTEYLNRNERGLSDTDNVLIRVFDIKGYKTSWTVEKGFVIVLNNVSDSVTTSPLTELRKKYGKENVVEVSDIAENIYSLPILKPINHIKIGGR